MIWDIRCAPSLQPQLSISPNDSCCVYHLHLHFLMFHAWEGKLNDHNNIFCYHVFEATAFHPYRFPKSEAGLQGTSGHGAQLGSEAPRLEREQLVPLVWGSPALLPCHASLVPEQDLHPRQNHTTCSLHFALPSIFLCFSSPSKAKYFVSFRHPKSHHY